MYVYIYTYKYICIYLYNIHGYIPLLKWEAHPISHASNLLRKAEVILLVGRFPHALNVVNTPSKPNSLTTTKMSQVNRSSILHTYLPISKTVLLLNQGFFAQLTGWAPSSIPVMLDIDLQRHCSTPPMRRRVVSVCRWQSLSWKGIRNRWSEQGLMTGYPPPVVLTYLPSGNLT